MSRSSPSEKIYRGAVDPTDSNSAWTKIVKMVPEHSRVLEIGCASGTISKFLSQTRRCTVTGIEVNAKAAAEANAFCQTIIVADVEQDALERVVDGPFDVIILADVLEHLRDPETVLRKTKTHLTPSGAVLLSLPNVAHWSVRSALLRGRFDYTYGGLLDDTHLRFFTYDSACELIQRSGFRITAFDLVHRCPLYWRWNSLYRAYDSSIGRFVRRYAKTLFGYQLVFRITPVTTA